MEDRALVDQSRGFFDTGTGYLNVVQFLPRRTPTASVLFVPPFGEEMNHCRRIMAEAARRLTHKGYQAFIVDLSGTGESSGHLIEMDLQRWMDDLNAVCTALSREPCRIAGVIGIRFGALLAAVVLQRRALQIPLIMWQPITSGAEHLREMAAQRAIADRLRGDPSAPSTSDVMRWLGSGRCVELGGYQIGPRLGKDMFDLKLPERCHLSRAWWIAIDRGNRAPQNPMSIRSDWIDHVHLVRGGPFWNQPSYPLPDQLLDATEELLSI